MNNTKTGIILFDGVCNLCNGLVQFIIKRDKKAKFKLGSLQSQSGQDLLKEHHLPVSDFDTFVYIKGDSVYVKSTGALHVLKDLGGIWKIAYVLIVIPKVVRDFVYSQVARNRYSFFGRREQCMVPTPEIKNRFLP